MRSLLDYLEEKDEIEVINNIVSNFYRMKSAADSDVPDPKKAKRLLEEFRAAVGNDPIDQEIAKRKRVELQKKRAEAIDENRSAKKRLSELNTLFISLHTTTEFTPQQRGYKLEDIFCDLLELNEMEYKRPHKTQDGEQIDGHFRYEKFDYLIESKWQQDLIKQKELSIFDGKIKGKAQSTRGLFIASNGFDENAVSKYSGASPRIILMTGEDLALVLGGQVDFKDAMKAKVEAIVRYGNINLSLRALGT